MFTKNVISKPIDIGIPLELKRYETKIKDWLKPIIDLSDFYVYPTNGITEGLTYWQAYADTLKCGIIRAPGEYEWVESNYWPLFTERFIHYISCPSALDGNFRELPHIPWDGKIALDIAYVGSTNIQHIEIDNRVEYVFFSLSKAFGLNGIRTGWMFTRKPDIRMHKMKKLNYYNHYAHSIAEKVISEYPIDYSYNKYRDQQLRVCEQYNFEPSDCVWLGTTTDTKYEKFFRGDSGKARICLSEFYT